ncbi:cytoskeletal protein CcmA (bactofilin family) [Silvimonas terrae]|uniref:Cytoskeletal protein CcmA (Bactofilin family) n=1 Tax=Silvimonas terrae TaxID=300266 RepID=A0A840RN51_9NEIS|nr:polymer-forming cytoskeletal protein [Silvimonas terrae]MBB5193612.1 cytoskeletal protein CcmA (bactofilin family) [Silvimonas terrae]
MFSSKQQSPILNRNQGVLGNRNNQPSPTHAEPGSNHASATDGLRAEHVPVSVQAETKAPAAPQAPADHGGNRLIVGPDVKLRGAEILDCDTLVVEGRVEATMDSRVIRIAEGGSFSGKVSIDVAEVHGTFDGELTAREQLIIHATGRVKGTIRYGKLLIESGGTISGEIESISDARQEKPTVSSNITRLAAAG